MGRAIEDRLQKLAEAGLGLDSNDLRLVPHNPRWHRLYSQEAHILLEQLRIESLRLYHCGSTAVPDLDAKPILDILGSTSNIAEIDRHTRDLEALGYEYKGEYGIPGRRYCILQDPGHLRSYIHLHLFQAGSPEITRHLHFRNLLCQSSAARTQYQNHKRQLVNSTAIDRSGYADAKSHCIRSLVDALVPRDEERSKLAIIGAAPGHRQTRRLLDDAFGLQADQIVDLGTKKIFGYSYAGGVDDDFASIIRQVVHADVLILATPVYWYSMSAVLKQFLDRFSDLLGGELRILGQSLRGKELRLVATGADSRLPPGFEIPFSATAIYFGMDYMGARYKCVAASA